MLKAKIFYFSGTGNTEFVSKKIKEEFEKKNIETKIMAIETIEGKPDTEELEYIGVGFPVYALSVPMIVEKFINSLPEAKSGQKAFAFSTSAGLVGGAVFKAVGLLRKKGFSMVYSPSFTMPGNTKPGGKGGYERPPEEKIRNLFENAEKQATEVAVKILADETGVEGSLGFIGKILTFLTSGIRPAMRKTGQEHFSVTSDCNLCKLCYSICPTGNIEIENEQVVFGENCENCLRCIHFCPQKAILKQGKTQEQYKAPGYEPPKLR
ncbi:MAG: EFR1 family ferrodoxin [Vulcanimicrobiota bacterium]